MGLQEILNGDITTEEIVEAVKKIKSGKPPRLDRFPIEFIKQIIHHIKYDSQLLFNYLMKRGMYQDKWGWGKGLRVAIPKGENDVRPITIEPVFAKILETIMDSRINFVNTAYDRIDKYNAGFLKGSQTQGNLLVITLCI